MQSLKNKVQLIGHLGNNPEMVNLESGKKLAKMSIATNESYRNAKGERVKETTWHNLIAWGTSADLAEKLLKKGSEIAIEGKLINRSYVAKDGSKKYVSEIEMNEFVLLGKKEA
ncbi:MAG: hypothetical protein RIQ89_384 [Bacteroidota bacterium]|jgi:single-strand DNA-binding protein